MDDFAKYQINQILAGSRSSIDRRRELYSDADEATASIVNQMNGIEMAIAEKQTKLIIGREEGVIDQESFDKQYKRLSMVKESEMNKLSAKLLTAKIDSVAKEMKEMAKD